MPILIKKPTAPKAHDRYENGVVTKDTRTDLSNNHGVTPEYLSIRNPEMYTVTERQGLLNVLFGRRPARITRITGTRYSQPDTVYIETPGHGIGVLAEPRVAERNSEDYPILQRRFLEAVQATMKLQGGTIQQGESQQKTKMKQLLKSVLADFVQGDKRALQIIGNLMQENPLEFYQILTDLENEGDQNASVIKQMIDQQTRSAKQGAKLSYLKELKGICPEGYLKLGGRCKPCETKKMQDPVKAFKAGRKCKK